MRTYSHLKFISYTYALICRYFRLMDMKEDSRVHMFVEVINGQYQI